MRRALGACTILLTLVMVLAALASAASPLHEARAAGTLGEQLDGYVGFPKAPDDATKALAAEVNANRLAHYTKLAKETGAPVAAVAAHAGQKLVDRLPKGQFHRNADGDWLQKP